MQMRERWPQIPGQPTKYPTPQLQCYLCLTGPKHAQIHIYVSGGVSYSH